MGGRIGNRFMVIRIGIRDVGCTACMYLDIGVVMVIVGVGGPRGCCSWCGDPLLSFVVVAVGGVLLMVLMILLLSL